MASTGSASTAAPSSSDSNSTAVTPSNPFPTSTAVAAPRAEEIAAGARRLTDELGEFLEQHTSLQTASTVQAAAKSDVPELQLATCRKLREVCIAVARRIFIFVRRCPFVSPQNFHVTAFACE